MKFSSIIFSAAAVVPAFFSGTTAKFLPDSHPCADACQVHRHVCSTSETPEGLWNCLCLKDRPLLQDCANCIKDSSLQHSRKETALILVIQLLGATCPQHQDTPGASMPKLSNEALKRAADQPVQFVDSFLELFQDEDDNTNGEPVTIPPAAINDTSPKASPGEYEKAIDGKASMPSRMKPHISNTPPNATVRHNMTKNKSKSGYGETSGAAYWSAADGWFMALGVVCLFLAI